jgi:nicotinamidase-related amidase
MQPARLTTDNSILLVIDIQDKLLAVMPDADGLIRDVGFLIDAARLLEVPVYATEQYPKGLGPTTAEIARRLPASVPSKVAFSSCGAAGLLETLRSSKRANIVLSGMETHVCVLHTALDLLGEGFQVFLPVDGLQARYAVDHDMALRRLEKAGSILTTVEATAFEWLGGAHHPQFKPISKLIQERMSKLAQEQQ